MFNTAFWVYDAEAPVGRKHVPFILWPHQEVGIAELHYAAEHGNNLIFDKSRKEGATEIIIKYLASRFLLIPDESFLVGSRKEDLVDQSTEIKGDRVTGPHQTLFHKILYALVNLPPYMQPNILKRHRFVENLWNGSKIEGEATTDNFGAGNRAKIVLVDECARIEPAVAQYIIDNIHDTSPCCVYNSTHFRWGAAHPYNRLIAGGKVKVVTLGYEENPTKNMGLYTSPEPDIIEISDIDYYRRICPEIFNKIDKHKPFSNSDLVLQIEESSLEIQEKMAEVKFVADGGMGTFNRPRSIWFDAEEASGRRLQDLAINVLRIPQGSADQFFDHNSLELIRGKYVRDPDIIGKLSYDTIKGKLCNIEFTPGRSKDGLKWWGKLVDGKPDPTHNYIVSCDISRGTGASNSVLTIADVNLHEVVGLYVDPFIDVPDFAEYAIAICKWCKGGTRGAFLIWEGNGPGDTFASRVKKLGYPFIYYRVNESTRARKKATNPLPGWWSTTGMNGTKNKLLGEFDAALAESLKDERMYPYLIIHDNQTVNELNDYIFLGDRVDVGLASQALETSGAKFAHGDRVISAALVMLALKEQPKAIRKQVKAVRKNCMQARIDERRAAKRKKKVARKFLND